MSNVSNTFVKVVLPEARHNETAVVNDFSKSVNNLEAKGSITEDGHLKRNYSKTVLNLSK